VSGPSRRISDRISDSEIWRLAGEFTQIVWRVSADGERIVAPTWTLVTGQMQADMQGGGWLTCVHEADRARVANDWAEARAGEEILNTEFRLRLNNGSHEWFRVRAEPVCNRRGRVKGWIGIASNIDEQKRSDAALRDAADRIRLIVDAARAGTMDWALDTDHIDINSRGRELLGLSETADVTIDMIESAIEPEDRQRFRFAVERSLDPGGSGALDGVFRVSRPSGPAIWVGIRGGVRFLDADDSRSEQPPRGVRLLGVLTDLSREMRELEDRAWLSTLVASSNDAIIAQAPDGVVTHWNAAAERIYGYTADEMVGDSVFRIVPPDQANEQAALLESARHGGDVSNIVTERLAKDGRRLIVAVTLSPIRDATGGVIGLSAIERDITAERFREAQLHEAQKLEAVGQLAGGVAHDLNNILTAMMAGVHLVIQKGDLDTSAQRRLSQVREECFRASGVIRELLAFGRKQVVTLQNCRLNDIVRETEPMLARLIGEDVHLDISLRARKGVYVDRAQMMQVIVSLAVYARDSMPDGGTLTIETADDGDATATGARQVALTVTDTGVGITAETRARLFEPYFTTRKLGWGTGLGLSVVHSIIERFHGTIDVESEPGEGSVFTILLPATDLPSLQSPPGTDAASTPGGRETILLVEDERVLRDQIADALRDLGYTVLEARNGYDALTVLERHNAPVHLVLSDVVMPEMNGATLVAQLREWYPTLRVLFITGYSEQAVASYGVVMPDTALLLKPFMIPDLAARIRAVLDGPRQAGVADSAGEIAVMK